MNTPAPEKNGISAEEIQQLDKVDQELIRWILTEGQAQQKARVTPAPAPQKS
jgi:hypothetical protein